MNIADFIRLLRGANRAGWCGLLFLVLHFDLNAQEPSRFAESRDGPKNLAIETVPLTTQPPRQVLTTSQSPSTAASNVPAPPITLKPAELGSGSSVSPSLTLDEAVRYALANNPQLAVVRQQAGIAAAGVVIAKTYPFNPILQTAAGGVSGPASAGITNRVFNKVQITLDVEIQGQRSFRKEAAFAALTRTDWEISNQEILFSIATIRAFDGVLYQQAKLALTEEFLKLNQTAAQQVKDLVDLRKLVPADLILARAEVNDIQSQIGLHRTSLVTFRKDLARSLGRTDLTIATTGTLDRPPPTLEPDWLLASAMEHRPDLFARKMAVSEADAKIKLQIANRFGNPNIGPVYEYNETSVNFIGLQVGMPLPFFNRTQGEIQQRQAERMQAVQTVVQTETEIHQDVVAAVAKATEARAWLLKYKKEILPDLRKSLDDMDNLFKQGQPGVDILRLISIRQKLLHAQDGYLDALLAYTQALADLGLAVGDPALAMGLYQPDEIPPKLPVP